MSELRAQLATEIQVPDSMAYVEDDRWAVEQKLDGHRLLLHGTGDSVIARGRSGDPYGNELPKGLRALHLPEGWVLDGELVNGALWAFDLIPPGRASLPLRTRRLLLETLVQQLDSPTVRLVAQETTRTAKAQLVTQVIRTDREGFVFKDLDAPYSPGRSKSWLKVKLISTVDAVVLNLREGGREAAGLGVYQDGEILDVGRASIVGKGAVNVGDVVELKYLYVQGHRLVQPRIIRVRTDKPAADCDVSQLKYTNKQPLEA